MARRKRPLEKKARRLRARMRNIETARRLLRCQLPPVGVLALFVLASHLFALPHRVFGVPIAVWNVGAVLMGLGLAVGIVWSFLRKPTLIEAAAAADEKMHLRERISTALFLLDSEKRMDRAVVEDAETRAASLRPGDVFPYPLYRELRWLLSLGLAIALIEAFMPPMLLFANRSGGRKDTAAALVPAEQAQQTARELTEMKQKLESRTEIKDPLQLKKIEKDLADLQKDFETQKLDSTMALAKLSKLNDQVKERQSQLADKAKSLENVRAPENARFTKELSKDMETGDLQAAKDKLAELKSQVESGKLSEQDKQNLANELDKLAEQLKENPALAEKLKQAAVNLKAGSAMKAADDLQAAQSEMGDMAEMLQQMAALDELEASVCQCKNGMAAGQGAGDSQGDGFWGKTGQLSSAWKAGDSLGKGAGMGQAGKGMGGQARVAPDQVAFKPDKVKGETQPGKILASFKVNGEQVPGESNVQYQESYIEYRQKTEDTLQREAMPLEYKSLVTDYFDSIKPQAGAAGGPSAAQSQPAAGGP